MKIILDTNVALNLWFFNDAQTHAALAALLARAQPYGTPAMLAELMRVARSPHLSRYVTSPAAFEALERSWRASVVSVDADHAQRSTLRCRDRDDQLFLDFAQQIGAQTIVTLDRDLLKLAKRAKMQGLSIAVPFSHF